MPRLACWSCGRQIYTVSPLESLFSEERRCPRCGAFLNQERRERDRRNTLRRQNPEADPGPPDGDERRLDERRKQRRRGGSGSIGGDETAAALTAAERTEPKG
jgi:hypothetical protein